LHRDDDDDDDVDGVRLRLRTAAINGPIFRPLDYITGENPGNPTSTIISSEAGGTGEGKDEFCFTKYLFHTLKGSLTCCKILRHGADCFTFSLKEGVLRIFVVIKNLSPSAGFELANLDSNGKHANQ
jgi:hypothetical protein